jgi:hypothetical protein
VQLDVEANLTVQDFRSGQDTVLQVALSQLRKSGKK